MHGLARSVVTVVSSPPERPGIDAAQDLFEEAHRLRRRRRLATAAAALVLTSGAVAWWAVARQGARRPSVGSHGSVLRSTSYAGVFPQPTGLVLVFHDGYDGVLSVDLDHRVAARRVLDGQRAGDQPWDIVRVGTSLVVGWDQVWAAPIAGGPSRLLGQGATITFFPAAEPGQVWLDYPSGPTGNGPPTLREVDVATGTTTHQGLGPDPSRGTPVVGIPGGVAFATSRGVALWNASTDMFTRRLGTGQTLIGDAAAGRLAWCEGLPQLMCSTLHITDLAGGDRAIALRPGRIYNVGSARFSPNGKYLAIVTTHAGIESSNQQGSLMVMDSHTGSISTADPKISAWSSLAWNDSSSRLFFASQTNHGMVLGQYVPTTGHAETAAVPILGAHPFVILSRPDATSFLAKTLGRPSACPAPNIGPSGRSGVCGCRF